MKLMGTGSVTSNQTWPAVRSKTAGNLLTASAETVPTSPLALKYPHEGTRTLRPSTQNRSGLSSAIRTTIATKWFWYSIVSSLCWTAWAFTAKIGSKEIPPATMEFISGFGFLLVCVAVLAAKKITESAGDRAGKSYALVSGVLLALGGICLYGAYRTGYNVSVITAMTSLYPMVTVLAAVRFLREKLNWLQVIGLFFAAVAMLMLSL
jgi:uncharacterized membrane protein